MFMLKKWELCAIVVCSWVSGFAFGTLVNMLYSIATKGSI